MSGDRPKTLVEEFDEIVSLARIYLEDGARLTAAEVLERMTYALRLRKAEEYKIAGTPPDAPPLWRGPFDMALKLGMDFGSAMVVFKELQRENEPELLVYADNADSLSIVREGELEVDDGAIVSKGDDSGAYVMAWLWVSNEDAGIDEDDALCICPNCSWEGPVSQVKEAVDLAERVAPGEPMPEGECPECGALVHKQDDDDGEDTGVEAMAERVAADLDKS